MGLPVTLRTLTPWLALAVALLFSWGQGWKLDAKQDELKAEREKLEVVQAQLEEVKGENAKLTQAVDTAIKQFNASNDIARRRGAELERLRQHNAILQARIKASPRNPDTDALGRCSELLQTGAGLLSEGERLLQQNAAEHDALIGLLEGHATIFTRSTDSPK